jgi:hypothetical protein
MGWRSVWFVGDSGMSGIGPRTGHSGRLFNQIKGSNPRQVGRSLACVGYPIAVEPRRTDTFCDAA